ncbi:MAG: glucose 1-dehydrogenase [Chloroflexia bacterium]|nr:glucose 1-dehydrogenase [Chloroflexia bacterium]
MPDLSGKVVIVTGASTGIGYEIALRLGRAGAAVVAGYNKDEEGALRAVRTIAGYGGNAIAAQVTAESVASCREFVQTAVREFGQLDIACCHAGITSWGPFLEYTEAAFDEVVSVNLRGTYFLAQAAAHEMVRRGAGGRIIVTSSVVGVQAVENLSAYAMTKGGLQALTRNLVLELSPYNITINCVAPGSVTNARNLRDDPEYDTRWAKVIPLGRAGEPSDIASAVLFFASEEASWITGQTLVVDGGLTAYSPTPYLDFVEREGD